MEENGFATKDIFEAAFLYASLKKLPKIERDQGSSFSWFVFPDNSACQDLIESYWNRKATVDPKAFADAFRSMKDILFRAGTPFKERRP